MALDIAALQDIYGANTTTATGDDVYMLDDTQGSSDNAWVSIWDAGGTDTMRYDGDRDTDIDLREATLEYEDGGGGFVSSASGVTAGFTIANGVIIENAIGGNGNDTIVGNEHSNEISGRGGSDDIDGGDGNDTIDGNAGGDDLSSTSGTNTIYGSSGNDVITGGSGNDIVDGGSGDDTITDSAGRNTLSGGRGDDTITGGSGDDTIIGGMGQDSLNGGTDGADVFVFEFASDSYAGADNRDTINGFDSNDLIDLSAISGLEFSASFTASGTGQVVTQAGLVRVDVDGDGTADMEIAIGGNQTLNSSDFIL